MNPDHIALLRQSMSGLASRRGILGGLASVLAATGLTSITADGLEARKKGKTKKKRKARKPKVRADARCSGVSDAGFGVGDGDIRLAQAFTARTSGPLVRADLAIAQSVQSTGDYILHLGAVDAFGVPTNEILAATSVPSLDVPDGLSTLSFSFARPFSVVAGTQYALVLTQPGSDFLRWNGQNGDLCPGRAFVSIDQSAPFESSGNQIDLIFTTFVRS
jgi:hypothetical protein